MERASQQKQDIMTSANKNIWLKQEAYKLRHQELEEDKQFVDNERREQLRLVELKHEIIQKNLESKNLFNLFQLKNKLRKNSKNNLKLNEKFLSILSGLKNRKKN